jgi:hypothetical protein
LTGFNIAETAGLENTGQEANEVWSGMPEFENEDKTAFRSIVVHFKDQGAVDKFAKLIKQPISEKTPMLWFPEIEIERYSDKYYTQKV